MSLPLISPSLRQLLRTVRHVEPGGYIPGSSSRDGAQRLCELGLLVEGVGGYRLTEAGAQYVGPAPMSGLWSPDDLNDTHASQGF